MPESQGISRRDLLKRGAALGGAVVWATPVVQTLGMGRAFAQNATPVGGKDISYIGINVDCDGDRFFVKWDDGDWETSPGAAPDCAPKESLPTGQDGGALGFVVQDANGDDCKRLTIPAQYAECDVTVWVKAGSGEDACNTYTGKGSDFVNRVVCSSTA